MLAVLAANVPIVLLHGINSGSSSMDHMQEVVSEHINGSVINCEIGNGPMSSIFMTIDEEVGELAKCISSHPETADGFIGVGYSQGAYLMRSYLEQKSHIYSPMLRFISISGPLGGFYCGNHSVCVDDTLPFLIEHFVYNNVYKDVIQESVGPAQYWRDPYQEDEYYRSARHLPVIDNYRTFDPFYKQNFMSVDQVVLFGSSEDGAISPWQSAFFGHWKKGTDREVVTFEKTDEYLDDLFGLRTMHEQGRIVFIETTHQHSEYVHNDEFIVNELMPYLIWEE